MKNPNELGTDSFPRVIKLDADFRIVDLGSELIMEMRSEDSLGVDRWWPASEEGRHGTVAISYRAWLVLVRALARASDEQEAVQRARIFSGATQEKLPSGRVVVNGSGKASNRKQRGSYTRGLVSSGSR